MYTAFYGLREKPFALSPDPRYLFLAEAHREALAHLLYGIDEGEGFIAVTGEVGTGKTTLCRTLLQRVGPATDVAFLFNPTLSSLELMQAVNAELGLPVAGRSLRDLHAQLNQFLLARKRAGRRVLLIIDEAQNLSAETLEQIRLLSNLETETQKLLQIVLIGQPELDAKLASPELRQLRQRITVHWRLAPLAPAETRAYVRHRLRIAAGGDREIFSEAALREIHRRSRGVPRVVNVLCDRSLLAAYAARSPEIGVGLVKQADGEIRGPEAPLRRRRWAAVAAILLAGIAVGFAWRRLGAGVGLLPPFAAEQSLPAETAPTPSVSAAPREPVPPETEAPDLRGAPASEPARAAPAPPDLGAWLETLPPGDGLDAALAALGARERNARVLSRDSTNLVTLRLLNRPAVLVAKGPAGTARHLVLRRLDGESALVTDSAADGEPLAVALAELEARWTGEAHVVWRDFEALPPTVGIGDAGPPVAWLQRALAQLGLYAGPASGRFDQATQRSVIAFQLGLRLTADGVVGPLTKMALYDALGVYPVTRLSRGVAG